MPRKQPLGQSLVRTRRRIRAMLGVGRVKAMPHRSRYWEDMQ